MERIPGTYEYDLHEMACNIAEDLDNGFTYPWRVEQVKDHLRAGGTTAIACCAYWREEEVVLVGGDRDPLAQIQRAMAQAVA